MTQEELIQEIGKRFGCVDVVQDLSDIIDTHADDLQHEMMIRFLEWVAEETLCDLSKKGRTS